MGRSTERFEAQHAELTSMGKALLRLLDTRTIAADARPVRLALAAFAGRLRIHAAMENQALYPRLLASPDPEVAAKAQALFGSFGTLYEEFFVFLRRWSAADVIQQAPEDFARETMRMLHLLGERMRREDRELYPLADA